MSSKIILASKVVTSVASVLLPFVSSAQSSSSKTVEFEMTQPQLVLQADHESRLLPDGDYIATEGHLFEAQYQSDWADTRSEVAAAGGSMMLAVEAIAQMNSAQMDDLYNFQQANPGLHLTIRGNGVALGCQLAIDNHPDPLANIGYEAAKFTWETAEGALRLLLDRGIRIDTLLNDGPVARLIGAKNPASATGCDSLDMTVAQAASAYADFIEVSKLYLSWYNAGQDYGDGLTAPLNNFPQTKFVWSMNAANWMYQLPSGEIVPPVANNGIHPDGYGYDSHGYVNCNSDNNCTPLDLSMLMDTVLGEFVSRGLSEDIDYIAHEAPYWTYVQGTITSEGSVDSELSPEGISQLYKEVDWVNKIRALGMRTGFWVNPYIMQDTRDGCDITAALAQCSYGANEVWHDEVLANIELFRLAFEYFGMLPHHDVHLLYAFDQNVPTVTLPETHSGDPLMNPYSYMQTANDVAKLLAEM